MSVVLLIDDEIQTTKLVQMALGSGVQVVSACDLSSALAKAEETRPDVVLLDLELETEDGLRILPSLRESPSLAGVPIIIFSVHDSRREEALDLGVQGFVPKPFRAAQLIQALRPHVSGTA